MVATCSADGGQALWSRVALVTRARIESKGVCAFAIDARVGAALVKLVRAIVSSVTDVTRAGKCVEEIQAVAVHAWIR